MLNHCVRAALVSGLLSALPALAADYPEKDIERGPYLTRIAGAVPEAQWLAGDKLGHRGPWGTTYPPNLRLLVQTISEEEWLKRARTMKYRPPMPWFALRDMNNADLSAIYRFIRSLGPAGEPAPAWVPPDREPAGPVVRYPGI